jgi:hypothetical protein
MNVQCAKTSCLESLYIIRSTRVTVIEFSICRLVRECKNTDVNDNGCQLRTVPLDRSAITMLNANWICLTATLRQVWSKLTLSHTTFQHFPRTEKNYEYHQKAIFVPRTPDTKQELCTLSHDDLESPFTRTIESLFFGNNDSPSVELTSSSSSSSSTAEDYNTYRFRFVREVRSYRYWYSSDILSKYLGGVFQWE